VFGRIPTTETGNPLDCHDEMPRIRRRGFLPKLRDIAAPLEHHRLKRAPSGIGLRHSRRGDRPTPWSDGKTKLGGELPKAAWRVDELDPDVVQKRRVVPKIQTLNDPRDLPRTL
jgi:hypothetical protein